jgi:alanyl-tRNA synthetase
MTGNRIREKYLEFFKNKGHTIIPPAPLVLQNDPTTLFTSSGMQPLVPYLKGEPHPSGNRLVDSQPSFRAEDIDEVGDNRHTTFFEMLGNWSLGDYFKKEQLSWFFEFLTQTVGLDAGKLYVTVFEGNHIVPQDEESIALWQQLFESDIPAKPGNQGFDPNVKIYLYGADKNWWSRSGTPEKMPPGEIGGPDSEVFYDFGPELKLHQNSAWKNEVCHVNCDCGRFLEIGNSVFMEYVKQEDGFFAPLPKQNVDFGGGLERITAAANNDPDVFNTDLFNQIIESIESATGKHYKDHPLPMRIIADHAKAAIFMIAEGIEPANKMQGYILRRLIRRAVLKMQYLEISSIEGLITTIVEAVSKTYRPYYLAPDKLDLQKISQIFQAEANKFDRSLKKGLREFEKLDHIDGKIAFNLLQTYGFPWELTFELAQEKGYPVVRQEFEAEFAKHRQKSRQAAAGIFKGGLADHSDEIIKFHTATHLLHQALRQVLGEHVHQMGSNITAERLRFDFKHSAKLTQDEVQKIESLINQKISEDLPVHKTIESKDEALKSGALAFFRETYPDQVSVYTIGSDPKSDWYSKELCGGPHVSSTAEIGPVTIKKEKAIGADARRIYITFRS